MNNTEHYNNIEEDQEENKALEEYNKQKEEEYNRKITEATVNIQKSLIDYTNHNGLSLCENLDYNNIENYIKWCLENKDY
jgi:hypothetical protein